MDRITYDELEIVKKYYRIYLDQIPENKEEIWYFLDSIQTHDKEKHFNDEELELTVSEIVDQYFKNKGRVVYPYGKEGESFTITDEGIEKRKSHVVEEIKDTRDRDRRNGNAFRHYDGGACAVTEEYHGFFCYVYDHYYDSIGASWKYS